MHTNTASRIFVTLVAVLLGAALLAPGNASAAVSRSGWFKDIRLSVGITPGVDEVDLSGPGGDADVSLDDEVGFSISPQFAMGKWLNDRFGIGGIVGLFYRTHSGEDDVGEDADLTVWGGEIGPLFAVRVHRAIHLEAVPYIGFGIAKQELLDEEDDSASYVCWGGRIGGYYTIAERIQLGLDVGYLGFTSDGEMTFLGTNIDTTYEGDGFAGNLTVGYSF